MKGWCAQVFGAFLWKCWCSGKQQKSSYSGVACQKISHPILLALFVVFGRRSAICCCRKCACIPWIREGSIECILKKKIILLHVTEYCGIENVFCLQTLSWIFTLCKKSVWKALLVRRMWKRAVSIRHVNHTIWFLLAVAETYFSQILQVSQLVMSYSFWSILQGYVTVIYRCAGTTWELCECPGWKSRSQKRELVLSHV